MPQGVHFTCVPKESQAISKEPIFHPFVITRENGAKVYGFSLTFYEQVHDESIINAVVSLQTLHAAQALEVPSNNQSLAVGERPTGNTRSLPRHFKVPNSRLIEIVSKEAPLQFDPSKDLLLVTKCICLTGQYPLVEAARNFLNNIYRYNMWADNLKKNLLVIFFYY